MPQTFFDVIHDGGQLNGLKCNICPLRRAQAERMAAEERKSTWHGGGIKIVPTGDQLWEDTYGDDAKNKRA